MIIPRQSREWIMSSKPAGDALSHARIGDGAELNDADQASE
jgi:hypothetical protein